MKLAIFGATGATGMQITEQALANGHSVSVLARTPEKMTLHHADLTVIQGDVLNIDDVTNTVAGADAVICTLGSGSLGATTLRTDGTRHIITAMNAANIKRLVVVSAMGIGDSAGQLTFVSKLFVRLMLKNVMQDHASQEALVMSTDLDWVIVRPSGLTNKPATGNYQHGLGTDLEIKSGQVARADVAEFVLDQLTNNAYLRQAVSVT